jgi:hypothetical protein
LTQRAPAGGTILREAIFLRSCCQHREVEMSSFDEYANKYKTARMERRNGVLQVTLHSDGQSLRWGFLPHSELPEAFHDIGADRENRVVILTGTGDEFSGPRATPGTSSFPTRPSIERIDRIHREGRHLLMNPVEHRGSGDQCDQWPGVAPL